MENIAERRKGEVYVGLAGLMWAFFPVVTVLSYAALPSIHSLAWSTLFAACTFAVILTYREKWVELQSVELWKYVVGIALFIGILFYGLYYVGLETTTPGNAAIIGLFEVFTSFIFFHVFRGEKVPRAHIIGGIFMVVGALIILGKGLTDFKIGDMLILVATMCTPLGNYFQQHARRLASSEAIMFLRSAMSVPFLFALAFFLHPSFNVGEVRASLVFLLINGVLLLGISKIFWIEAIHRVSVPKAIALQSGLPLLTLLIAWLMLGQTPNSWQLLSLVPLVAGVLLLTDQARLQSFSLRKH